MATWSTAYVNDLPDSSFLFIESGGEKDSSGKTTPRSLRHLPYKDKSGKVDLPHLRNAISRLGQSKTGKDWKGFNREATLKRAQKILAGQKKEMPMGLIAETELETNTELENEHLPRSWVQRLKEKFGPREKEAGPLMPTLPTTFDDLDSARAAREQAWKVADVFDDFMTLSWNIIDTGGGIAGLKELVSELGGRLDMIEPSEEKAAHTTEESSDDEEEEDEEEETKSVSKAGSPIFIWKGDDGTYCWMGVYSNKFRDDDSPSEILSEKSHLGFIERVEKGELEYPDLYIWHLPVAVGKANLLAYDDAGFSIVAGTIQEQYAKALMDSGEDLAMSHGMPAASIKRDPSDPTIIEEYVSTEVSVLPRWAAANKMTDFSILEEGAMAIIPEEKRQQISGLLGDDLTEQLESSLAARSNKALAEGIEFKEEETKTEEVATEETESEEKEEVSGEVAETESVEEVSDTEVEDGAEEAQSPEAVATGEETGDNLKGELVAALEGILETVSKQNQQIVETLEGMSNRVSALERELAETKEASKLAGTPTASLSELLAARLGAGRAESVIGKEETRVDGRTELGKAKPEQANDTPSNENALFFTQWR